MNKFWFYWIPGGGLLLQCILEYTLDAQTLAVMHTENGSHELAQFAILVIAALVAAAIFLRMDRRADRLMTGWVVLAFACCVYVAGEEVSWGQHFLDWTTPERWATLNDQAETNLHNTTSWLDQKPRLALMLGIGLGGLVFPILQKWRSGILPARFQSFYPPASLWLIAVIAISIHLIDKMCETVSEFGLFHRTSEVQELYMFYFVLAYLVVLYGRLVPKTKTPA